MKLVIGFDTLVSKLDYVSTVVEDRMLDESMRNIIFRVTENSLTLIGYNSISICKTKLGEGDYRLECEDSEYKVNAVGEKEAFIQLKARDLNNLLGTFKSMSRTKATDVTLSTDGARIKVKVHEESDDIEQLNQDSVWVFGNIPVKQNVLKEIAVEVEEGTGESVASVDVLMYLQSFLPILINDGSQGIQTKLHFSDDWIYAIPRSFSAMYKNMLPDCFKGIVLGYSALEFLSKVLSGSEFVTVGRTPEYVTIESGSSVAFLKYMNKFQDYTLYLKAFTKEHVIGLDRAYLKDVLKRLSISDDHITFEIEGGEDSFIVRNSKFSQRVPITQQRGMEELGKVTFKVAVNTFSKAILGDDSVYSNNLGLYISKKASGYALSLADEYQNWFSLIQVR